MSLYLESLVWAAQVTAPIFFIVFLGIFLKQIRLIDDAFVGTASKLVFTLTLPVLVFMAIIRTDFQAVFDPHQLIYLVGGTVSTWLLLWWLAARWIPDGRDLGVFIQGAFRGNYGVVGLAVSYNLFGDAGLAQGAILLAMVIPLYNTLSIICLTLPLQRENSLSPWQAGREIIKNPLILAVLLALPFSLMNLQLPAIVDRTAQYFADMTLPLALLSIGGALSLKSLRDTSAQAAWATACKLAILPALLTAGAWLYGFEGQQLAMLFVLFGCPTAAASFVMARAMGGNAQLAANIVLTTTLGSTLTLSAGIYMFRVTGVI
ncbi:MAG: AEC family transporter [Marinobacterium sp.]|nr:AEC family transporter [Marinobacterium sp.]